MGLGRAQNWYYNPVTQAWEIRGKAGAIRASVDEVGVYGVNARFTTGSLANANISVGTITNVNVGTLATMRTAQVAGIASLADISGINARFNVGTIQNMDVGTLATIRAAQFAGVASLADAQLAKFVLAGGTQLIKALKLIGTMPSVVIGTGPASAVASLTGMTGIVTGDSINIVFKAAPDDKLCLAGAYVSGADNVSVKLTNPNVASALTTTAVGVDVLAIRS